MVRGADINQQCLKLTAYFAECQRTVGDGARGAAFRRGIWGFHGNHKPMETSCFSPHVAFRSVCTRSVMSIWVCNTHMGVRGRTGVVGNTSAVEADNATSSAHGKYGQGASATGGTPGSW
jgi:hypothetical protein